MPEDVFAGMRDHFSTAEYQLHVLRAIDSGSMWAGIEVARRPAYLRKVFDTLPVGTDLFAYTFAHVLFDLNPSIFGMMAVNPNRVTAATFGKVCDDFAFRFDIVGPARTAPAQPAAPAKPAPAPRNNATGVSYTVASMGTDAHVDRNFADMVFIPGTSAKGVPLHAVGDTGSQVTLVTLAAARRLGLHVSRRSRPQLMPLQPDAAPRVAYGRANVELRVENSPRAWANAVVVDWRCRWEVLLGRDTLATLRVSPASPVMVRRSNGPTRAPDHAGGHVDGPWRRTAEALTGDGNALAPGNDTRPPSDPGLPTDDGAMNLV